MKRRGFLSLIGAALTSAALDPERALWIHGAKTISIPKLFSPEWTFVSGLSGPGQILIGQTMGETFNNFAEACGFTWGIDPAANDGKTVTFWRKEGVLHQDRMLVPWRVFL